MTISLSATAPAYAASLDSATAPARSELSAPLLDAAAQKDRAKRIILAAIDRAAPDQRRAIELRIGLYERLLDFENDNGFGRVPIADIIARLCRSLGVAPDSDGS